MKMLLRAYENGDHTCLIWFPEDFQPIPDCRGFALKREKTGKDGKKVVEFAHNFTGFTDDAKPPAPGQAWKWPIQRYLWWDYFVKPGDAVRYSVIPVTGSNEQDTLKLDQSAASAWTDRITVTGQVAEHMSAYFNKGIIATQWVTRELNKEAESAAIGATKAAKSQKPSPTVALKDLIQKPGNPLRGALSGLLRPRILKLLEDANQNKETIFAALYELNDPELLAALKKFGSRANVILANGAFNPDKKDENAEARKDLKENSKVNVFDRMVTSGHFAHNKFVAICDKDGNNAHTVITGSTNWTVTGLCTQANNALIICDPHVAGAYRGEWDLLKDAKNDFPAALKKANSQKKTFQVDNADVTVWFVPTLNREDMQDARRVINGAKEGILFLFFNPGAMQDKEEDWTLLQSVLNRHNPKAGELFNADLYIRGVVNQKIAGLTEGEPADTSKKPAHPVQLFAGGAEPPTQLSKDSLVPAAIKQKFGHWEPELLSIGVMVHSKVVVIDPFGDHPVLITGSHNLGVKASRANDDNLVIVAGPGARGLAIAFAVNIIAIYQEYRFRHYVATHAADQKAFHHLQDDDEWQKGHLTHEKGELEFWMDSAAKMAKVRKQNR